MEPQPTGDRSTNPPRTLLGFDEDGSGKRALLRLKCSTESAAIRAGLTARGWTVVAAFDRYDKPPVSSQFDLIITDMPDRLRFFLSDVRGAPVVILLSDDPNAEAESGLKAGATAVLGKPFNLSGFRLGGAHGP